MATTNNAGDQYDINGIDAGSLVYHNGTGTVQFTPGNAYITDPNMWTITTTTPAPALRLGNTEISEEDLQWLLKIVNVIKAKSQPEPMTKEQAKLSDAVEEAIRMLKGA